MLDIPGLVVKEDGSRLRGRTPTPHIHWMDVSNAFWNQFFELHLFGLHLFGLHLFGQHFFGLHLFGIHFFGLHFFGLLSMTTFSRPSSKTLHPQPSSSAFIQNCNRKNIIYRLQYFRYLKNIKIRSL